MATATIDKPDNIKCTLKFSMEISEWKQVRKTLNSNAAYTELMIIREIDDLVSKLEQLLFAAPSD